jgi:hypothetical protein
VGEPNAEDLFGFRVGGEFETLGTSGGFDDDTIVLDRQQSEPFPKLC